MNGSSDNKSEKTKTVLVLSGGGAKGAFQYAAEKYAREVKGYEWDIIVGVSAGALNATMVAMKKYDELGELWRTVENNRVYTGTLDFGLWPPNKAWRTIQMAYRIFGSGERYFLDNSPLRETIDEHFDINAIDADLRIGVVSMTSGIYKSFKISNRETGNVEDLKKIVVASTSIPVIFPPVDAAAGMTSLVDGGIRNVSPLGDIIEEDPGKIVIINCDPRRDKDESVFDGYKPQNIIDVLRRTIDIMSAEIFLNDIREFERINDLVRQAWENGIRLFDIDDNTGTRREFKAYESKIIQPDTPLDDVLDFSRAAIDRSLAAGTSKAEEVLG